MPEADLALLTEAAEAAGRIALSHFRTDYRRWDKPDGAGPVTEADLAVDEALKASLAARPDTGWLSEETPDDGSRLTQDDCWIVDPIDGTRAFVEGAKDWAISAALVSGGRPVAAVVHMPARGLTYAARHGGGATLNGAPIRCAQTPEVYGATVLANKAALDPGHWPHGVPPVERHFRSSLAYRLCLVAEGRFDGMITLRPAWHWDIAAGALICTEAGAEVSDGSGADLRFDTQSARSPGTVAAAPGVHAGLMGHLRGT